MAAFRLLTIQSPTSTGTVAYTHNLGVTPVAAIIWTQTSTSTDALTAGAFMAIGFTDGASQLCASAGSIHGVSRSNTSRVISNSFLHAVTGGEVTVLRANFSSWNATTITLNWTTVQSASHALFLLLIGGSDVSARVVQFTNRTSVGTQTISGIPFPPKCVLFANCGNTSTTIATATAHAILGFGAATSNAQYGTAWASRDNVTTSATYRRQTNAAIVAPSVTGSTLFLAQVQSFTTDGFVLNWFNTDSTARPIIALALGGNARFYTGSFTTSSASGNQTVSGLPFAPELLLAATFWNAQASTPQTNARMSIGAAVPGEPSQRSINIYDAHGISPIIAQSYPATNAILVEHTNAVTRRAALAAVSPNSFTLTWSGAGSAHEAWFLALASRLSIQESADPASYVATGAALSTHKRRTANAVSALYAISGQESASLAERNTYAAPASYYASGFAVAAGRAFSTHAAAFAYVLQGAISTIHARRGAHVESAAYVLSRVEAVPARLLTAQALSSGYAVIGQAIASLASRSITAEDAHYAATHRNAIIAISAHAQQLAFEINGLPAGAQLIIPLFVQAHPGLYTIYGGETRTIANRSLHVIPGMYTETGLPLGAARGLLLPLLFAAYATYGATATPSLERTSIALAGSFFHDGNAAALTGARLLGVDAGMSAISGTMLAGAIARMMTAIIGAYAVLGSTASSTAERRLIQYPAAYVIVLETTHEAFGRIALAEPYAYTTSGHPSFVTAARSVPLDDTVYAFHALDSLAVLSRIVSIDAAPYVVDGAQAHTFSQRLGQLVPGIYLGIGTSALLGREFAIWLVPATYLTTGFGIDFGAQSIVFFLSHGAYGLFGLDNRIQTYRLLNASSASVEIVGALIREILGRDVVLLPASYDVSGDASTLLTNRIVVALPLPLLLAGSQAFLLVPAIFKEGPTVAIVSTRSSELFVVRTDTGATISYAQSDADLANTITRAGARRSEGGQ